MKYRRIFILCIIAPLGLLCSCQQKENPLNAPSSKHQRVLGDASSKVAASLKVINENPENPEAVKRESDLALILTGQPKEDDLKAARKRMDAPEEETYTKASIANQELRNEVLDTAKNNLKDVITVKKTESREERKDETASFLRWVAIAVCLAGLGITQYGKRTFGLWVLGFGGLILMVAVFI